MGSEQWAVNHDSWVMRYFVGNGQWAVGSGIAAPILLPTLNLGVRERGIVASGHAARNSSTR